MILIWNHIYPGPSYMGCPKCARLWAFHFNWSQLNQLEGFPTKSPSHDQCNFFSCQHIRCFRQFLSFSLPFSLLLYDQICRRGSNQRRWTPPPHHELEKMSSHIRCCLRRSLGPLKMFSLCFYLRNLSRYAVRLPALWILGMRPIVEHRKLAEDARASGSECSYTLDLTAVTNLCIS